MRMNKRTSVGWQKSMGQREIERAKERKSVIKGNSWRTDERAKPRNSVDRSETALCIQRTKGWLPNGVGVSTRSSSSFRLTSARSAERERAGVGEMEEGSTQGRKGRKRRKGCTRTGGCFIEGCFISTGTWLRLPRTRRPPCDSRIRFLPRKQERKRKLLPSL